MADKIVLNTVLGTYDVTKVNANFAKVEDALNNEVLYRDNDTGSPNEMNVDLDMNGKRIYNLPAPFFPSEAARLQDIHDIVTEGYSGLLAAPTGAGLVGYNPSINYIPGSVGSGLAATMRGDEGKVYRAFGYVVRNGGSGWAYIDDVDHRPTGMSTVEVVGDVLRVNYGVTGVRVLTHIVGTDETMAALGMTCGPSVGLAYSDIKMFLPFACWVEKTAGVWAFGASDGCNPWFGPGTDTTIASSGDGSTFTITHKEGSGSHPPTMTVLTQAAGGSAVPGVDVRMSYGGTSVIGTSHADFEGYIVWTGPGQNDWTVSTPNISVPTCTFSAGVLTVTHENLGTDTKAVSVDGVGGTYLPASGSTVTGTTFQVVFQDYAGANVATANGNMKFRYSRPRQVKSKAPDGMRVAIQRGPVILNPAKVISTNGNLWGYGVLETV